MHPAYITEAAIQSFIATALEEDIGEGDHSSLGAIPLPTQSTARLLIKDNGILAGVEVAEKIFHQIDPQLRIINFKKDGDQIEKGEVALGVKGSARSIL